METKGKSRKLTKHERDALPRTDFALPAKREYPIPDRYHAHLALGDMKHEASATQSQIRKAIEKRYPGLPAKHDAKSRFGALSNAWAGEPPKRMAKPKTPVPEAKKR